MRGFSATKDFTNLDFPEIEDFPYEKSPFKGNFGRVRSGANLTRTNDL